MNVAILGASDTPSRYSYKAMKLLEDHGHTTKLVHPRLSKIEGKSVYKSLSDIEDNIDTLAMYVNSNISSKVVEEIKLLAPRRVIFNPGAENPGIYSELEDSGIKVVLGCVLVMLNTGTF